MPSWEGSFLWTLCWALESHSRAETSPGVIPTPHSMPPIHLLLQHLATLGSGSAWPWTMFWMSWGGKWL